MSLFVCLVIMEMGFLFIYIFVLCFGRCTILATGRYNMVMSII